MTAEDGSGLGRAYLERGGRVRLFECEPELLSDLDAARARDATRRTVVQTVRIPAGAFKAPVVPIAREDLGVLVLRGLMLRRATLFGRRGAELLGASDVLSACDELDRVAGSLDNQVSFSVYEPVEIAILNQDFGRQAAQLPGVLPRILGRASQRASTLADQLAIAQERSLELRLLRLLWLLSGRWGRRVRGGVVLRLRLPQGALADMACAHRQSVNETLGSLAKLGLVTHNPPGWMLHGEPPAANLSVSRRQDLVG